MQNHFELFQLPARFEVDQSALDAAYREIQGRVHPDRFVGSSDGEKRVAMQWATRANDAYQTLRNPQKRAQYLCELNGIDLQTESNTAMPAAFLMQQMEWREELSDARSSKDVGLLESLLVQVRSERSVILVQVKQQLDKGDYLGAAQSVRALMFLEKMSAEIGTVFEIIEGN